MPDQKTETKLVNGPGSEAAAALETPPNEAHAEPANTVRQEEPMNRDKSTDRVETLRFEEPQIIPPPATPEPPKTPELASTSDQPAGPEGATSREELEKLKAERDQLVDRLARLQAEFENARKRAERDRVTDRDYATGQVIEQFLPVLDNFELALKSEGTAEQLRSGVELIVKKMEEVLRQLHVHPIPAIGEEFDPRHHEALGTVERLDLPDQHVAEEIRRGYKLRQRLLRPALVRVASNPKQKSE